MQRSDEHTHVYKSRPKSIAIGSCVPFSTPLAKIFSTHPQSNQVLIIFPLPNFVTINRNILEQNYYKHRTAQIERNQTSNRSQNECYCQADYKTKTTIKQNTDRERINHQTDYIENIYSTASLT